MFKLAIAGGEIHCEVAARQWTFGASMQGSAL